MLTKREEERGRKRDFDAGDLADVRQQTSKRARSSSSHSVSSVSTISTNRPPSASPTRHRSYDAKSSRPRTRSLSPDYSKSGKRRYSYSSSDYSNSSVERPRSRSRELTRDRNTRRRRRESSPVERGRPKHLSRNGSRGDRSRSQSMDRSRIARERRSVTPDAVRERKYNRRSFSRDNMSPPGNERRSGLGRSDAPAQPPRKERSLSPYSKRLALTQAMNMAK